MIEPDVYRSSNPFRSSNIRPGANAFVFADETTVDELFRQLCRNRQGEIVGPHGSGKSTLMIYVVRYAESEGWHVAHHILDARNRWQRGNALEMLEEVDRALPEIDLVAVDGFEQLSRWQRSAIVRKCRAHRKYLLITSHHDMGLADIYRTRVNLDIAYRVVAEICGREQIPSTPSSAHLSELLSCYRGNLRETLFALYDEYQAE